MMNLLVDLTHFTFWVSGVLMMASQWQLEIIRIRASRGEFFSMPFFITVSRNYKTQSAIGLATMLLSYAMILVANGFGLSWVGIIFFLVGFWQMAELQFKTISLQPYKPPFLPWASEEIGMDKGTKKLNRMVHVSFWGDIYLFLIFISYILTFL